LVAENAVAPFWDGFIWRSLKASSEFQLKVRSRLASENSKPSHDVFLRHQLMSLKNRLFSSMPELASKMLECRSWMKSLDATSSFVYAKMPFR